MRLASGHSLPSALTSGYQLAFLVSAGLLATAAVLAAVLLRTRGPADGSGQAPGNGGAAVPEEVSSSPGTRQAPAPADRRAPA